MSDGMWVALTWAFGALGAQLVLHGVRGRMVLPRAVRWRGADLNAAALRVVAAGVAGVVVVASTGWPVAGLAATVGVWWVPRVRAAAGERVRGVARTDAIASWAEMVRDNMAGAAGLEQALVASAGVAPAAIGSEIDRFVSRLERMSLTDALAELGEDLDHPSGDLVIAALTNAARMEARDLGALLSRLAESIRADVRMRLRIEVGRARIRTSARIVVSVTGVLIGLLFLTARDLLRAYDSAMGQVWLAAVLGVFCVAGWVMGHYGRLDLAPDRFSARRVPTGEPTGPGSW